MPQNDDSNHTLLLAQVAEQATNRPPHHHATVLADYLPEAAKHTVVPLGKLMRAARARPHDQVVEGDGGLEQPGGHGAYLLRAQLRQLWVSEMSKGPKLTKRSAYRTAHHFAKQTSSNNFGDLAEIGRHRPQFGRL